MVKLKHSIPCPKVETINGTTWKFEATFWTLKRDQQFFTSSSNVHMYPEHIACDIRCTAFPMSKTLPVLWVIQFTCNLQTNNQESMNKKHYLLGLKKTKAPCDLT